MKENNSQPRAGIKDSFTIYELSKIVVMGWEHKKIVKKINPNL